MTAAEQSAGRGRQGRTWSAPAGSSLLLSVLLRDPPRLLPLAAAVAVAEVVGEDARIKWPNDIVVGQPQPAKVAGILVEGRRAGGSGRCWGSGSTWRCGCEDLPAELRPGGSRPAATMGRSPDQLEATLATLLDALERRLAEPAEATLQAWRARDALLGREIAWAGGSGVARGLDGAGRLIVEEPGGRRTELAAGEVHLQRVG